MTRMSFPYSNCNKLKLALLSVLVLVTITAYFQSVLQAWDFRILIIVVFKLKNALLELSCPSPVWQLLCCRLGPIPLHILLMELFHIVLQISYINNSTSQRDWNTSSGLWLFWSFMPLLAVMCVWVLTQLLHSSACFFFFFPLLFHY